MVAKWLPWNQVPGSMATIEQSLGTKLGKTENKSSKKKFETHTGDNMFLDLRERIFS